MRTYDVITEKEFEASLHYGYYEGFVKNLGYVYWGTVLKSSPHPNYPLNGMYAVPQGTRFVDEIVRIPMVIPEEELINGAEISTEAITQAIMRVNADNTLSITFFNGKTLSVNSKNSSIDVFIAEEFFDGKRMKVVTIKVKDGSTGIKTENKTALKDVLNFMSDAVDYASMLGPLEFHMGRHMSEVRRFRPIVTQSGNIIANSSSRYRYSFIPGKAAEPLAKGLRIGGAAMGVLGIFNTLLLHDQGEISDEKALLDGIFGVVGFMGLPGMLVSLYYSVAISPYLDDPRPVNTKKWDDISLPQDNTRVILPDPWIGEKRIPQKNRR